MANRLRWAACVSVLLVGCGGAPAQPTDPRPLPSGTIFRQGTFDLPQAYALDLDTGEMRSAQDGDVWFQAVTPTERFLTPETGATLSVAGPSDPGLPGCSGRGTLLHDPIPVQALSPGLYLCGRTSENRTAILRIITPPGPYGPSAAISFAYTVFVD